MQWDIYLRIHSLLICDWQDKLLNTDFARYQFLISVMCQLSIMPVGFIYLFRFLILILFLLLVE